MSFVASTSSAVATADPQVPLLPSEQSNTDESLLLLSGRMDHAEMAESFHEIRGALLPVEKADKFDAKENKTMTIYFATLYHPNGRGYRDERAVFSSKTLAQRWLRRKMWTEGWVDPDAEEKKRVTKMNDDDFLMYAREEDVGYDIFRMELDQDADSDDDQDGGDDNGRAKNASCAKNEQENDANDAVMKC